MPVLIKSYLTSRFTIKCTHGSQHTVGNQGQAHTFLKSGICGVKCLGKWNVWGKCRETQTLAASLFKNLVSVVYTLLLEVCLHCHICVESSDWRLVSLPPHLLPALFSRLLQSRPCFARPAAASSAAAVGASVAHHCDWRGFHTHVPALQPGHLKSSHCRTRRASFLCERPKHIMVYERTSKQLCKNVQKVDIPERNSTWDS